MRPRTRRCALLTTAAAALLAIAPPSSAQQGPGAPPATVNAARDHFQKALKLNASGNVEQALHEFQTAYDLSPNWRILYNIGQTSRAVHDYGRSLKAFQRYLAEGGDDVPKARKVEVDKEIASLKQLVADVDISAPEGSTIRLDGNVVGTAPLAEHALVNAGKHKVTAEHEGQTETKDLDARPGGAQRLEFGKADKPVPTTSATAPPPPPPPATAAPETKPPRDNSTWITLGAVTTGVLAVGAGVTGTLALVFANQLKNTTYAGPDHRPPDGTKAASLSSRVDTLAIVTDALVGGAIVAGGLTIYFVATNRPGPKKERSAARGAAARLGPGSVVVTGSF